MLGRPQRHWPYGQLAWPHEGRGQWGLMPATSCVNAVVGVVHAPMWGAARGAAMRPTMGACAWPQPRQHQCPPQLQEPVGNNCKEQFAGTMHYKGWVGASPLPATHPQLPQGWPAAGAAGQAPRLPQGGKPSPLPPLK